MKANPFKLTTVVDPPMRLPPMTPSRQPALRRPHDHHRDLRAGLPAALSTIDDNRSHQDRYLMTTSTGLPRPRVDLAPPVRNQLRVRSRLNAPSRRRNRPPTTARNVHRHDQTELLLPTSHVIARDQTHRAPPHAPSALAKSP